MNGLIRLEVDGHPPTAEQLYHPALVNYGHLTALQVRSGRVQGLNLHLSRLAAQSLALFDTPLDPAHSRALLRHAVRDVPDAAVRVNVYQPSPGGPLSVLVAVRPPAYPSPSPLRLMSVPYQRPVAHIKHLGGFGQIYWGRAAVEHGFDDALLTTPAGEITEAAVHNIAFFDGAHVVWPDAPCLPGIAMQLLEPLLPSRRAVVTLSDLARYRAAFVTNSIGVVPVTAIDEHGFTVDEPLMTQVTSALATVPWDDL
ncbi:aminotransferase class IV [Dactylosporangium aurantiacum]|uniref:Aminotransferase class IV n=1 Tax=Dactylosporangium aurantiacum TaxID=35754 RepID=A0A9Q9I8C5_9ACTN|nr:aminotransferase class IV [Dactylosporangium aurantiacum]MDG6108026.1 aminotransferase class IV [Dactylosporangium aurantiacum]UWZ50256.1 aminotransferase class IV [Dactylosporangium aurantiacum]